MGAVCYPFSARPGRHRGIDEEEARMTRNDRRPSQPSRQTASHWTLWQLPDDLSGRSFLDVGCWEGHRCADAVMRGASEVVGVDLCVSPTLRTNVERHGFDFLQLDVLSEKFLELDRYDVVLCAGLLYHVENPMSLCFRLRKCARELLVLETAVHEIEEDRPLLLFHPGDDLGGNPSNWWTPNERGLGDMLETAGFVEPRVVHRTPSSDGFHRVCVHAGARGRAPLDKLLPRRRERMGLAGGERPQQPGMAPTEPRAPGSD
jgi:SAM-dependent methyltransferase